MRLRHLLLIVPFAFLAACGGDLGTGPGEEGVPTDVFHLATLLNFTEVPFTVTGGRSCRDALSLGGAAFAPPSTGGTRPLSVGPAVRTVANLYPNTGRPPCA